MNEHWTIPAQLAHQAERRPDHPFLVAGTESVSFAQAHDRVERLAGGLRRLGVGPGRTVALLLDNGIPIVETWFALARLGAIQVPLNPDHRGQTMEHMVATARADVLVCAAHHLAGFAESSPAALAAFATVVVDGPGELPPLPARTRLLRLDELRDGAPEQGPAPGPKSPYAIMYTSGTTGVSKGVLISHHYGVWAGNQLARIGRLDERDVMYCCLPLFHQGAQADCVLPMLAVGGTVAITDRFSARRWWDEIDRFGATTFIGFAAMLTILFRQPPTPRDADNPVRVGLVGHVLPEMHRPFEERFGLRLLNVYGMTETEHAIYPVDWDATPPGSMGVFDDEHFEVALLDADDEPVPDGVAGEICVRPRRPHIMMDGYYGMPAETLRACRNLWFHTGDLARRDADGYVWFVDRLKESIRRRGENVSSTEVEQILVGHDGIAECAVVAVPSDLGEDEVMAFVVPARPDLAPEDVVDFASPRMASFMVPRFVELVDRLPRTQTNKIAKAELRQRGVGAATWDRERRPGG